MNGSNLGLTGKILLPTILTAVLMLVLSYFQISALGKLAKQFGDINSEYLPGIDLVLNADRDLYQAKLAERSLALGMKQADLLTDHEENVQQVYDRVNKVKTLAVSAEIKQQADRFLTDFNQWRQHSSAFVKGLQNGDYTAEQALAKTTGELDKEFSAIRGLLNVLGETVSKESLRLNDQANAEKDSALTTIYVLVAIALIMVVLFAIFFPRAITNPVNLMAKALETLASGKGDLNARMQLRSSDELGVMAHNFNAFMDNLKGMISSIREESDGVSRTTEQIHQNADTSDRISSEYSSAMEMVATSNEQMGLAIREVSENTQQVSTEVKGSDDTARQVAKGFDQAMMELQALVSRVDDSSQVIQALEAETTNIESVLDVIKGIAEQTNLLALNAAIEAARAGEQGRGFAVVADEVRTLASRTQQSTGDINQMIERLRAGVGRAVGAMRESQNKAEQTVEYAGRSQRDIQTISASLVNISDRIIQIASAIEEQTSVIGHINQNLTSAKVLSEQGQESVRSTNTAVRDLQSRANRLSQQVSGFRL
ncbi:methyl-accepting chemotaxis protein [Oceanobacter mangrovi]|uniref:methyl-accepting chemotaxis protein n=1 Tax=Oceanobacter mangrovi TaxID=2862510 RepID=UPI001C8E2F61|nr:methyl-accepting chemotaxis protein [Oceanobacter mangrovi]